MNYIVRSAALPLLVLGLLSGCSKEPAQQAPDAPAPNAAAEQALREKENAEAERQQATDDAAREARQASYRKQLAPLLAGSYNGTCQGVSGGSATGPIDVSAAGAVTAGDVRGDLVASKSLIMFKRDFVDGKPSGVAVVAGGGSPEWVLTLKSGSEETVQFVEGAKGLECKGVAATAALRERTPFAQVMQFFSAGARQRSCAVVGTLTRSTDMVQVAADGVTAGKHSFSFTRAVAAEQVGFPADVQGLSYALDYVNGDKLVLTLDRDGKIDQLIATGKVNLICDGTDLPK